MWHTAVTTSKTPSKQLYHPDYWWLTASVGRWPRHAQQHSWLQSRAGMLDYIGLPNKVVHSAWRVPSRVMPIAIQSTGTPHASNSPHGTQPPTALAVLRGAHWPSMQGPAWPLLAQCHIFRTGGWSTPVAMILTVWLTCLHADKVLARKHRSGQSAES